LSKKFLASNEFKLLDIKLKPCQNALHIIFFIIYIYIYINYLYRADCQLDNDDEWEKEIYVKVLQFNIHSWKIL
jgi:hypothetical protein